MAYTMEQAVKAGLAFNPLASPDGQGEIFVGANQNRLAAAMRDHQWEDPRFVTRNQMERVGWRLREGAVPVQITVREANKQFDNKVLFNASQIDGIPPLEEMLKVARARLTPEKVVSSLREDAFIAEVARSQAPEHDVEGEALMVAPSRTQAIDEPDLVVGPARKRDRSYEDDLPVHDSEEEQAALAGKAGISVDESEIEVIEITPVIRDKIIGDEGPAHVGEQKVDHVQSTLLGKVFKERVPGSGEYVREGEKKAAFMDKGGSLLIRDKQPDAYQAVMELAKSKGWQEIELSGKRESVAKGWLEAQLLGITVTNYVPTEQDMAALDKRRVEQQMAQAGQAMSAEVPAGAKLVTSGTHIGPVADIADGYVIQKASRNGFVAHKLSDFAVPPKVNEPLDVQYKDGKAMVMEGKTKGKEMGGGREIGGR